MAEVVFVIAALGAIAGAIGTVAFRNPFYSVLSLVAHLLCLAALFLLLRAEFVAAAQVVVYAGAVMVLYVFVAAYVGDEHANMRPSRAPGMRRLSILVAAALFIELAIALLGTGLTALGEQGAGFFADFGSPAELGRLFLTDFLLAFEIASFLLLVATIGAVVLARRREGIPASGTLAVSDLLGPGKPGHDAEKDRREVTAP